MRLSHLNRPFASTHRKRPYRKKVTSITNVRSSQRCDQDLGNYPVENTAAVPLPPPSSLSGTGTDLQQHDNTTIYTSQERKCHDGVFSQFTQKLRQDNE